MKTNNTIFDIPFQETEDLERQVLADAVSSPEMLGDVLPLVHVDFFTKTSRRTIWETIVDQYNTGKAIDLTTIASITGKDFIEEVIPSMSHAGVTVSCLDHAALLRTGAARRRAYFAAIDFLTNAVNPKSSEADILSSIEAFSAHVTGPAPLQSELKLSQALEGVKADIKKTETLKAQGKGLRIRTGFPHLDDTINGGLLPGQLVILAARPSVGKTAVVLQMAKTAALTDNPVVIFSLEMTCPELCERLLFSTGKVKPYQISHAEMDWQAYVEAEGALKPLPIFINDFSRTLDNIVSRLTQAVKQGRCKIAVIDYLGLIQDAINVGNAKLCQTIAKITGTLKAVAKRLGIPIILLSQLNRDQAREKRSPELFDLRDSGSIEQDSDIVIMLEPRPNEGCIYAWLRKNRGGKRDIAFMLVPNSTYSAFIEEGLPIIATESSGSPNNLRFPNEPTEEDLPD